MMAFFQPCVGLVIILIFLQLSTESLGRRRSDDGPGWAFASVIDGGFGPSPYAPFGPHGTFRDHDEPRCPSREREGECICVPQESCRNEDIVPDRPVIRRRGRRDLGSFIDSVLGSFGVGVDLYGRNNPNIHPHSDGFAHHPNPFLQHPDSYASRSGVNVAVGGGNGGGGFDFTQFIPRIDVRVDRDPNSYFGGKRKEISVDLPFPGIRVHVNKGRRPGPYPSSGCTTNCGFNPPTTTTTTPPPPTSDPRSTIGRCQQGHVCCKSSAPLVPPQGTCGRRSKCGVEPENSPNRRYGRQNRRDHGECQVGEYPWMGMVFKKERNGSHNFLCNAALIDEKRVITIAQCVEGFQSDQLFIRLGEWDVISDKENMRHEDHDVSSIRIHANFRNETLVNDMAVISVQGVVTNKVHISPICLPYTEERFQSRDCVVTGWGSSHPIMQEYTVECLDNERCERSLRSTGSWNRRLDPSHFCAQTKDRSQCSLDGGAALTCRRRDGSYTILGLLSWSVEGARPDVYQSVQYSLPFLRDSIPSTTYRTKTDEPSSPSSVQTVVTTTDTLITTTEFSNVPTTTTTTEVPATTSVIPESHPEPSPPQPAPLPPKERPEVEEASTESPSWIRSSTTTTTTPLPTTTTGPTNEVFNEGDEPLQETIPFRKTPKQPYKRWSY